MMAPRRKDPPRQRPLKRKVGVRSPRKTLVVFCEGERTEPEYLHALKRQPFIRDVAAVDLRVESRRDGARPLDLVSMAVETRDRARREEAEIDEFWCVFDVEWPANHPRLSDAVKLAGRHDIRLAVSNPCFELWLVLHFREHGQWVTSNQASKLRRQCDNSRDKGLDPAEYMPRLEDAVSRAAKLDQRHGRDGTEFPDNNPSSGMHKLIAAVLPPARSPVTGLPVVQLGRTITSDDVRRAGG